MDSNGNASPADCDGAKMRARMRPRMRVMNATASQLGRAIEAMSIPGILVDHRLIADGDELFLLEGHGPITRPAAAKAIEALRAAAAL